ncbi:alpha/beta hydrolase [Leptolyngbya valderiana BDU 20041]|nr:alpha/beta hydrolase [Leptolyngbya valderiana BDU 20041]
MTAWLNDRFPVAGHTIRCGVLGPAEAPPIVLVHGTPFSSHEWHRVAPWLARHFRVYAFDLLGYGQSDKGDLPDVSLGIQNAVLAAALEHWQLAAPHVVAHDFGGATALRGHLLNGLDYASLTLIDPVALRPWGSPFVSHVRRHEAAFAGMPAYAHEALLDAYLRTAIARPIGATELQPYKRPWLGAEGQTAFYRQIAQMDMRYTDEVEGRYGEVRCPTQVLWATDDAWIPLETGRRLAGMLPLERFVEVPGAGHLVQEDAPEAILAALSDFAPLRAAAGGTAAAA